MNSQARKDVARESIAALRHISSRELLRNGAAVLDEIEKSGKPVVITRYNRRAVVIKPIAESELRERLRRPRLVVVDSPPEEEVVTPDVRLTDVQRRVLLIIAGFSPRGWLVDYLGPDAQQGFTATAFLFGYGLVMQRGGGWATTKAGWALAERIAEEEAGPG